MTHVATHPLLTTFQRLVSENTIFRQDEPLARRTTLRVGGTAEFYCEPANEPELSRLLEFTQNSDIPFMLLGRGSNLLIRDGGIPGLVICLSQPDFSRITIDGQTLSCGAGARLKHVAVEARRQGLAGLEFLEGIPGSVGGALRMNAGAMGGAMLAVTQSIRYMTLGGETHNLPAAEIPSNYRHCPFFETHVALAATLNTHSDTSEAIERRMKEGSEKRWKSQPAAPSAGCIFKNSTTIPSGKLIEELGLKGKRIGGAAVSDVHGNFIVNENQATAQDVLALIEFIQQKALTERGIRLETEVQIVGVNKSLLSGS
ncbi:MAG: UDP-N-acetylmuramate dehydrogenase [Verrucomicrobia bacterium]|nr:UDP-N-acetylmuramate dehydrogenase [Verrucomicrobiota bacterium]